MRSFALTCFLLAASSPLSAQPASLSNARLQDQASISDPAAANPEDGQWLAFRLPVQQGSRSPCCWQGSWDAPGEGACLLAGRNNNRGTRGDAQTTEEFIVFSRFSGHEVVDMLITGPQCPVDAGGAAVVWLDVTDPVATLDWLQALVEDTGRSDVYDEALHALASHSDPDATSRLRQIALQRRGERSSQAVFWLGESRGAAGVDALQELLSDLKPGATRQSINFALAESADPRTADLLAHIALGDPSRAQRDDALFWLAQAAPDRARPVLLDLLASGPRGERLEQAVFAISQLGDDSGDQLLMELATDPEQPGEVRRQALFWLTQSDNENTLAALTELLSH